MEELTTKKQELINKDLKNYTSKIKKCGDNIRKNYIKISHLLTEVDSTECYLEDGFTDTMDYASAVLGIQKTTTYNLLKIGKEYIAENGERTILTDSGVDYSVSQLQALLPLGVEKVKEINEEGVITPEMSVRQIKALVKGLEDPEDPEDPEDDTVDGEVTGEAEEIIANLGSVDFLADGTIVLHGELPEKFTAQIEEFFSRCYIDNEWQD